MSYLKTFTDNYPQWGNQYGKRDPNVPLGSPSPHKDYPVPQP